MWGGRDATISTCSFISPVDPSRRHSRPKHSSLRVPPSPLFSLCAHAYCALFIPFHESSRLCGKKHPTHFHVSHPIKFKFKFKSTFFLHTFAMASYLRNLFSSGQSTTPAHGKAKSRSRTESTPAPSPFYVYTATPSTSSSGMSFNKDQRNTPLRYHFYRPSVIRPMIHVILTSIAARPLSAASHKQPHPDMNGA